MPADGLLKRGHRQIGAEGEGPVGLPGTSMPGYASLLDDAQIRGLVSQC